MILKDCQEKALEFDSKTLTAKGVLKEEDTSDSGNKFNTSLANDIKKWNIGVEGPLDDAMNAYYQFLLKSQKEDRAVFDEFEEDELNSDERNLLNLVATFDITKLNLTAQCNEEELMLLKFTENDMSSEIFDKEKTKNFVKRINTVIVTEGEKEKNQPGKEKEATSLYKLGLN